MLIDMIRVQSNDLYSGKEFGVVSFWLSILLSMAGRSHAEDARSWPAAERAKTFIDKARHRVQSVRKRHYNNYMTCSMLGI
jgi:hypothetical protein